MLVGYTYNDFILNFFVKHSGCTCQEKHPRHAEEPKCSKPDYLNNFYELIHNVHMLFFTSNISP